MIVVDCEQGSEEWHAARAGVITASMFKVCRQRLARGPNRGDYKTDAHNYAFQIAMERISGEVSEGGFETRPMRRGRELEPAARAAHELIAGIEVTQVGLVKTDDGRFGASPDGFIEDSGGAEYKCLVSPAAIRAVVLEFDLAEYMDQIQGGMWITERSWWHFGLYCPALEPVGKDLIVHPVQRDEAYINALVEDLEEFDALVREYEVRIRQAEMWRGAPPEPNPKPVSPA